MPRSMKEAAMRRSYNSSLRATSSVIASVWASSSLVMMVTAPGILSTAFGERAPVVTVMVSIFSALSRSSSSLVRVCWATAVVANVASNSNVSFFTANVRILGSASMAVEERVFCVVVFISARLCAFVTKDSHQKYFQKIVPLSSKGLARSEHPAHGGGNLVIDETLQDSHLVLGRHRIPRILVGLAVRGGSDDLFVAHDSPRRKVHERHAQVREQSEKAVGDLSIGRSSNALRAVHVEARAFEPAARLEIVVCEAQARLVAKLRHEDQVRAWHLADQRLHRVDQRLRLAGPRERVALRGGKRGTARQQEAGLRARLDARHRGIHRAQHRGVERRVVQLDEDRIGRLAHHGAGAGDQHAVADDRENGVAACLGAGAGARQARMEQQARDESAHGRETTCERTKRVEFTSSADLTQ